MPSREVFNEMIRYGVPVNKCPYNSYDSLASEKDLQELFNVLTGFKDINGNHPIITANTVVANPNFNKIRESGFIEYFYEPFTETLKKYPEHDNAFYWWLKGIDEGLFYPQFHGREHVNIHLWFQLLREKRKEFILAFDNGFWGLGPNIVDIGNKIHIQAALDYINCDEIEFQKNILIDGLDLFEKIFGFRSKTFIANNFVWDTRLNETLKENGIFALQGMKYQLLPYSSSKKRNKTRHYLGDMNQLQQCYLIRNCHFEPSDDINIDNVDSCIKEIHSAFLWNKPAIISSHRFNYIGFIEQRNRERNLKLLKKLFLEAQKNWPNIEFMTSEKLADEILLKNKT